MKQVVLSVLFSVVCVAPLFGEEFCSLDHAVAGIYAVDTATGKVLIDKNSDLSLVPSSCMKIVTTAAALQLLGADARFETSLEYDGVIDKGKTLHGNLYIHGGGDPCLGSDRIPASLSWKKQIEAWADAVQKLGIEKIEGRVIGDASRWEKALAVPSWAWEDLGNYYGAGASALSFHENAYALVFKPGSKAGDRTAILRTDPPLPALVLQNEVTTGPEGSGDRACIYGSEFSSIQAVRGTVPAAVDEFTIKGAIPDPAEFCAELLAQTLQERGISVEQKMVPAQRRTVFHTTASPTVAEIVHWTNQNSINLYAEHLLKALGERMSQEGSTQAGLKGIASFLTSQKIDLGGLSMMDGSGLSRKNLITAKQLVAVLLKMRKSEAFPIFFQSLPDQGGSVRAKTGSMSFIRGAAGYAGEIAFAIIINHGCDAKRMNEELKQFFAHLNQVSLK
jgi:D-alanyl-D-alanine carboxypeptidase/D-alanyl-D-alanine-endopeptidase (penicillin-binding protein 4)